MKAEAAEDRSTFTKKLPTTRLTARTADYPGPRLITRITGISLRAPTRRASAMAPAQGDGARPQPRSFRMPAIDTHHKFITIGTGS